MTRETKVGLLAGLALILLIGILVSDHLSVGQPQPTGELIEFAGSVQRSIDPSDAVPAPAMRGFERRPVDPQPQRELRMPEELTQPAKQPEPQRVVEASTGAPAPAAEPTVETFTIAPPAPALADAGSTTEPAPAVRAITDEPTELTPPRESFISASVVVPAARPERYHTANEPLYKIAEQYYSDGNKWPIIQKANKDKVGPEGQVRAGVRLKIPYIEEVTPAGAAIERPEPAPPAAAANAVPPRTIRVAPGDVLSALARKHLGDARRWEELLEANKDQLKRPEDLQVDMVLKLPAAAPAAASDAAANRPAAIDAAAAPARGKTYTVAAGDNLSAIARRQLGDESAWYQIYQANKDVMTSPDDLQVGVTLKIPSR